MVLYHTTTEKIGDHLKYKQAYSANSCGLHFFYTYLLLVMFFERTGNEIMGRNANQCVINIKIER